MMSTVQEVKDIIERAAKMPWGPACSAELARAVVLVDSLEGEEELRIEAYMELATAYQQGNEEWKALAPTAWLVTKFDENPGAFEADQIESLAWLYKNATSATGRNPAVSKEQALELSEGFGKFIQDQGYSMHAVHGVRFSLALRMGDPVAAHEELVKWRATPRDEVSDCVQCDPERQITEAVVAKDWERAVATAVPLLDIREGCGNQPAGVQALSMIPLLMSGRPEAAWECHVRSYRQHRRNAQYMDLLGQHMEFLVLSGRWQRALDILRDSIAVTSRAESAALLFDYLKGAALAAREAVDRGLGKHAFRALCTGQSQWCQGPRLDVNTSLEDVASGLKEWLFSVATLFDARNGNDFYTASAGEVLDEGPVNSEAEERAQKTWSFEVVGEREVLPEAISSSDVDETPKYSTRRIKQEKVKTTDDTNPYPRVDLSPLTPPASMQEAFNRFSALSDTTGFDPERQFIVDHATVMNESVLDIDFSHADVMDYYIFACVILKLHQNFDGARRLLDQAEQAIIALSDDTAIVSPGFFSKLRGRRAQLTRQQLNLAWINLQRSSCDVMYFSIRDEEIPEEVVTHAMAHIKNARALIEEVAPELNRNQGTGKDIQLVGLILSQCASIATMCKNFDDTEASYALWENLERAFTRFAPSKNHVALDLLLEYQELELGREKYMAACQYADQALRLNDLCDPYTVLISRGTICSASLQAHQPDEALAQAKHLNDVIHAFPTAVWNVSVARLFSQALAEKDRFTEATEILEEAFSTLNDSPYIRMRLAAAAPTLAHLYLCIEEYQDAYDLAMKYSAVLRENEMYRLALSLADTASNAAKELGNYIAEADAADLAAELSHEWKEYFREHQYLRREAAAMVKGANVGEDDLERALAVLERDRQLIASIQTELTEKQIAISHAENNYTLGWVTLKAGKPVEAMDALRESIACFRAYEEYDEAGYPMEVLARCYYVTGNFDGLRECVDELTEMTKLPSMKPTRLRSLIRAIQELIDEEDPGAQDQS